VTKVSKVEFRKALCSGALDGCEVVHGTNGCAWLRNGQTVAARHDFLFLHSYYLGE
jgi:hypothetical protein